MGKQAGTTYPVFIKINVKHICAFRSPFLYLAELVRLEITWGHAAEALVSCLVLRFGYASAANGQGYGVDSWTT